MIHRFRVRVAPVEKIGIQVDPKTLLIGSISPRIGPSCTASSELNGNRETVDTTAACL